MWLQTGYHCVVARGLSDGISLQSSDDIGLETSWSAPICCQAITLLNGVLLSFMPLGIIPIKIESKYTLLFEEKAFENKFHLHKGDHLDLTSMWHNLSEGKFLVATS